jgi:beta-carotene hydroxylase
MVDRRHEDRMMSFFDRLLPARGRCSGRVFRHPEDVHCAIYNAVVLACYGLAFWLWLHPEAAGLDRPGERAAFGLAAAFLLGWISGVNVGVNHHNHAHRPIFHSPRLNRWFGHVWTFSGGWPAFYWYHAHVVVHHANLLHSERDWTLPKRRADGRFEDIHRYVLLHWPWRYVPHLLRDFRGGRGGSWVRRRAVKDGLVFLALWSIPWLIDSRMALVLWLLPQWIANAVIMGSGMYVQHAGGVQKSESRPFQHSTTFLSRFFNLTMFNIGYHIEHHDHPQVHWSALPLFHERMKSRLAQGDAHVVPYGYYRAAHLCSAPFRTDEGYSTFVADCAPGFERGATPSRTAIRALAEEPA